MRDHWASLQARANVFGVSCDTVEKQQDFYSEKNLNFPLISDNDRDLTRNFDVGFGLDVFGGKLMVAKRVAIIIGEDGIVEKVLNDVKLATHGSDLLKALNTLED